MVEFIRHALRTLFKLALFIVVSGIAAVIVAEMFASRQNYGVVLLSSWAVAGLLLFVFPEIWKWLNVEV